MAVKKKKQTKLSSLIIVLVVAGICLLNWFLFLKPALAEIGSLREAKAAHELEIDALREKLFRKAVIEERYREMSEQKEFLLARIPSTDELPLVLGALEELVKAGGVEVESFSVDHIQEEEGRCFIPVSLRVGGSEEKVLLLLEELEQFTHLILTEDVSIDQNEKEHRLSVGFCLIFTPEGQVDAVGSEEEGEAD